MALLPAVYNKDVKSEALCLIAVFEACLVEKLAKSTLSINVKEAICKSESMLFFHNVHDR